MSHPCSTGCGTTVADSFVCWTCGEKARAALAELLDRPHEAWPGETLPGLLSDLDDTLARQTSLERSYALGPVPAPHVPTPDETPGAAVQPTPVDMRASRVADHLRAILVGWVRVLLEEAQGASDERPAGKNAERTPNVGTECPTGRRTRRSERLSPSPVGDDTPADTLDALAAFLLARIDRLRFHEAGNEAVAEIVDAVHRVRRVVDRAGDRWYAGRCGCLTDLYAQTYARNVRCHGCGTTYDVESRRRELLESVDDVLATATEIARALTSLDCPVSRSSVYGYAHRKRLSDHGKDRHGRSLYRLGDVRALVEAERARAS